MKKGRAPYGADLVVAEESGEGQVHDLLAEHIGVVVGPAVEIGSSPQTLEQEGARVLVQRMGLGVLN